MPLPDFGSPSNRTPLTENAIVESTESTLNNKTAISPSRLSNISASLLGYADGTPVIVEYYSKHNPFTNIMSADASFSLEKGAVSTSYTLIHDFEIRMVDELTIDQNPETNEMEASGQAILYPGFNPHYGDLFLYSLGDGQIGLFVVNDVKRLSINQSSHHQIEFHLYDLTSEIILNKIKASTVRESYFNKGKYLSDEITLLSSEGYNSLNLLSGFREKLLKTYISEFYDQSKKSIYVNGSYVLVGTPNNPPQSIVIYDPYMVEFINCKTSITERKIITQKAPDILTLNNDSGILKVLLDKSVNSLTKMWYNPTVYVFNTWSAGITSIINSPCCFLVKDRTEFPSYLRVTYLRIGVDSVLNPYIFSSKFYIALYREFHFDPSLADDAILSEEMTEEELLALHENVNNPDILVANAFMTDVYGLSQFELFVFNYLAKDVLPDIDVFITEFIKPSLFLSLTKEQRFYFLPILLHFIDIYCVGIK